MRFLWICVFALPSFAQVTLPTGAGSTIRGPVARPAQRSGNGFRNGYGGARGGWGGGYWGWPQRVEILEEREPSAPKAPILTSSELYHADHPQPVMREYGSLPTPMPTASPVALLAFRDGHVEPVWAYWMEGTQLAFVAVGDKIRKVPVKQLDRPRSESLNQQQGIEFRLPVTP